MKQRSIAWLRAAAFAVVLAAALAPGIAAAQTLRMVSEFLPPSSMMENNVVVGRETAKVRDLLARAGIPYTIELLPWKRAYAQALREADTCV